MNKIKEAIKLLISNLTLFSKIILTVWLPGSILIVFLSHYFFSDITEGEEIQAFILETRISNLGHVIN